MIAAAEAAAATAATTAGTAAASTAATAAGSIAAEEAAMMAMYEAGGMGAGEAAAGGGLLAEDIAMAEAMSEGAYGGGQAAGGLLSDPSTMLAQDGTGNAFASDYEKYAHYGKQGFKSLGQGFNKMPKPMQGMVTGQATQGLLGSPQQPQTTNISRPSGGGGGSQESANPYRQPQQMPQATPYAPTLLGGEDTAEMKRRLMMMMRQQGY